MADRTVRVRLSANVNDYTRSVERAANETEHLRRIAERFGAQRYAARASVNIREGMRELRRIEARAKGFSGQRYEARAGMDVAAAMAEMRRIEERARRSAAESHEAEIEVDSASAIAEAEAVDEALDDIDGRTARADIRVSTRGFQGASRRLAAIIDSVAILGPAAVAAGSAAAGGMLAFASAASTAAAGAGAASVAFMGVGDALEAMAEAESSAASNARDLARDQAQSSQQIADAKRRLSRAVEDQRLSAVQAAESIGDAERKLRRTRVDAAADVAAAQRDLADARQQAARDQIEAAQAVTEAERDLNEARARAAELVSDAQADLASAQRDVIDAQRRARFAQEELTRARYEAGVAVLELKEQVRDLALSEEGAEIRLIEARQRLNEVTADSASTSLDLRKARLQVALAEDRLSDVRQKQAESIAEVQKYETRGIGVNRNVIEAERALRAAERDVTDAKRARASAQAGVAAAEKEGAAIIAAAQLDLQTARADAALAAQKSAARIKEAERGVAEAQRQAARDIADAERALARAKRDAAVQQKQAAQQVADAQRGVQRALEDAAATMGKTSTEAENLAEAMGKLSPAGRDFVRFLDGLRPKLRELQAVAQAGMFPGLQDGITDALELWPKFIALVDNSSRAMGQLAREAGNALNDPFWQRYFDFLAAEAGPMIEHFGRLVGNLAKAWAGVQMAFAPMARDVMQGLNEWASEFAAWSATLRQNPGFQEFIDYVRQVTPTVLGTLDAIGDAIFAIVEAAKPIGPVVLKGIEMLAETIAFIASIPGVGTTLLAIAVGIGAVNRAIRLYEVARASRFAQFLGGIYNSSGRAGRGLRRTARFIRGPWGIAIGAAVIGLGALIGVFTRASREVDEYRGAIRQAAGVTGNFGEKAALAGLQQAEMVKPLHDSGLLTEALAAVMAGKGTPAMKRFTDALMAQHGVTVSAKAGMFGLTTEHTRLSSEGQKLRNQVFRVAEALGLERDVAAAMAGAIGGAEDETRTLTTSQLMGMLQTQGYQGALDAATRSFQDQAKAIDAVWAAQSRLELGRRKARVTEREYQAAVHSATTTLGQNKATLDLNTEAGRANDQALMQLIKTGEQQIATMIFQGESIQDVTAKSDEHETQLRELMKQNGFTEEQIKFYIDTLFRTPQSIATTVKAPTEAAQANLDAFMRVANASLDGIDDEEVMIHFNSSGVGPTTVNRLLSSSGPALFAAGGPVRGPGTGTSDSILAAVSNGEFVTRAAVVRAQGVDNMTALNEGRATIVPAFATGGLVPDPRQQGPATGFDPRQTGPAHSTGTPLLEDAVLNVKTSRTGNFERIAQGIEDGLGMIPDFNFITLGGKALAWARTQEGKPYIWGGVGPHGYDCSGFMSALMNVMDGDNPYSRRGTTGTFPWAGMLPGLGPGLNIGSTPNTGSGIGHMAGTVAGVNVESAGGVGVRVGPEARGARDPIFTEHAHYLGGLRGFTGAGAAAFTGEVMEQVRRVANAYGWGAGAQWNALVRLVEKESSWNMYADNPTSSAAGLFQKMQSIWGPVEGTAYGQALWGLSYIKRRYGSPAAALAFHNRNNYYDDGGRLEGKGWFYKNTLEPERVLSPQQTAVYENLIDHLSRPRPVMQPAMAGGGSSGGPVVGTVNQYLAPGASPREYVSELNHGLKVARRGGRHR